MNDENLTTLSYLSFKLASEVFAVKVLHVKEVLQLSKITKIPQSPDYLLGIINLRGAALPIANTRIKFGLGSAADTIDSCIMVLNLELNGQEVFMGALVDSVCEVFEVNDQLVLPSPSIGSKYKSEFIAGVYKLNESFILMIDMNKAISSEELSILQERADAVNS